MLQSVIPHPCAFFSFPRTKEPVKTIPICLLYISLFFSAHPAVPTKMSLSGTRGHSLIYRIFRVLVDSISNLGVFSLPRVYYRWFHVTPAEKPTCLIGSAISWVRQRLTSVPRKESSAVQLQRTLRQDQECSASLEFSQRTTGEGAIRRTISCQSSELVTAT